MNFDTDSIRSAFPALSITDNGKRRIYLDNPAGTQVPATVVERMSECLLEANANLGGYFVTAGKADAIMHEAHAAMADLLNAPSADDVIFGQNMTTMTLHLSRSIGRTFSPGDEIILTRMDHDANVTPWVLLARDLDLKIKWLPFNLETFEFELDKLQDLITDKTKLICVGGASNLTGTIHDIKSICAMAKAAGAWSFIDGVQSVPHVSTDVQDLDCDFLACSAYKFFGPHQGILYGRSEVMQQLEPYKVRPASDQMPWAYETGTQSHEGAAGVWATVEYFAHIGKTMAQDYYERNKQYEGRTRDLHAAMDFLFDYEAGLAEHLIAGLQQLPGVKIQGITDTAAMRRRVPTVAFTVDGDSPDRIARALGAENIFVWSGHNYALEAAKALGILESGGAVRVGPVHYNTIDELDQLLASLQTILDRKTVAAHG
jgi:cysteine desulfurase family protein (TIGR01976 family)